MAQPAPASAVEMKRFTQSWRFVGMAMTALPQQMRVNELSITASRVAASRGTTPQTIARPAAICPAPDARQGNMERNPGRDEIRGGFQVNKVRKADGYER